MKKLILASLVIGAAISGLLLLLDHLSGSELVYLDWEMPGITAAYLFWGAAGSSVAVGVTICWLVNAIAYSVPSFILLAGIAGLRRLA